MRTISNCAAAASAPHRGPCRRLDHRGHGGSEHEPLGTFCELRRIEMTRIRKSDLRETTDGMAIIIHGKSNNL